MTDPGSAAWGPTDPAFRRTTASAVVGAGDRVVLTVRSLTRPAGVQPRRALFPLLLVAQRIAHRRYLGALR